MTGKKVASILVGIVLLSVVLAYFGRPKPPRLELVSPRQELPQMQERLPGSTALAERGSRSYGLALVLVRSPYSASNAIALDSLRTWAADRFSRQPGFLHPVSLEAESMPGRTMVESLFYNLGAYVYYGLEDGIGNFLKERIASFHDSKNYASFRNSYFELFGEDADSATLLARYQSERAKLAVDVILWSLVWLFPVAAGIIAVLSTPAGGRFERLQVVLAFWWLLLALTYVIIAFGENTISMLVSSVVALLAGLYLWRPIALLGGDKGALTITLISLKPRTIALALWVTCSLLAIQILTWIRTGSIADPDPVMLLLSSLSGDFLHDPAHGKRLIMRIAGVLWIVLSLWTLKHLTHDTRAEREAKKGLASLQGPFTP